MTPYYLAKSFLHQPKTQTAPQLRYRTHAIGDNRYDIKAHKLRYRRHASGDNQYGIRAPQLRYRMEKSILLDLAKQG